MKRILFWSCLVFAVATAKAQAVYNTGLERDMQAERYIRLNYQNDFFTATDYYLTQGVILELAHPGLRRFPLSKIMIRPRSWAMKYGIGFEQNGYTPTDYVPAAILYGDRPFAGTLSFKNFAIATDTIRKRRIASALNTGVIGPLAGAGDIQTYIHERTPNAIPHGWHNQVVNDVLINYHASYEQQLLGFGQYLSLSATGSLNVGTVSDKATVGITVLAGIFHNPYLGKATAKSRFRIYLYDHPELSAVAYDATLQGGLFNRNSPYVIRQQDIARIVFRNNCGIVLRAGKLYLEYYQSFMTREFSSGLEMLNGGFQVGCNF